MANETGAGQMEANLAGLYDEYYDKIARYAYARIGNKAEAEDIAGEVFLRALDSLKSYEERGLPMQAWLFRIAHNMVVDYYRRMPQRPMLAVNERSLESGDNPISIAERSIEMQRVRQAMQQLSQDQRDVVELRFFGGLTSKEAGVVLNKSDGAVREMQRAAVEKLRKILLEAEPLQGKRNA
jgi:RNA polymerase sigma-70 factor (ECF subfamily)